MSWRDGECYLCPLQSLVVSFILFLVSTLIFSRTAGVLFHPNSSTRRFPRFPLRNLCSLVTLAVFSHLRCNGHSLLLSSYLSRIGRIENSSCSASANSSLDTFHFILHCPATDSLHRSLFDDSVFLYDLWSRPWGNCLACGAPWSSALPPSLGRDRIVTTTCLVNSAYLLVSEYLSEEVSVCSRRLATINI